MAVMENRAWTDERLDDLNEKVDAGFKEMREEIRLMRGEIQSESKGMRSEIAEVRSDMNALARVIMQLAFGLVGTMLMGFLGILTTLIVKL